MSKNQPGTVEKNSSTTGPPAGIEPTPLRCRCNALAKNFFGSMKFAQVRDALPSQEICLCILICANILIYLARLVFNLSLKILCYQLYNWKIRKSRASYPFKLESMWNYLTKC